MDLTFAEHQREIVELADRILADTCPHEVLRATAAEGPGHWPRDAWGKLADAGLTGLGLAVDDGGAGHGFLEVALVVEAVARVGAPLPAYATLVLGAAPIARFGSTAQRRRWLPGVADGSIILTGAPVGVDDSAEPAHAVAAGGAGHEVNGTAWYVPHAADAAAIVVPVVFADHTTRLVVVPADSAGVTTEALAPMSGEPSAIVRFERVVVDDDAILTGPGDIDPVRWWWERAVVATCVAQAGTCAGALALTAAHVSTREQFGVKLATLQAVSQRAADAWIDTETVRLTAWSAAWRLASGHDATSEVAVAKFFTAEAAQRVVAAAQHLHGGIGMDLDHPVHRYFRWAKDHEQRLGGGAEHLDRLGRALAEP